MNVLRLSLLGYLVVSTFFLESPAYAQKVESKFENLSHLLPAGEIDVSVLSYGMSPRTEELAAKWKQSIQKNAEWFADFAGKPPLPYHPNFGMTEEEYAEMIRGLSKMTIRETSKARLKIVDKDDVIKFSGDGALSPLKDLEIHLKDKSIRTPFGDLKEPEHIKHEDEGAFGPIDGLFWQATKNDREKGFTSVRFGIGRRTNSGMIFIDYRAKSAQGPSAVERVDVLIEFRLPEDRK